jgi:hypothetical protein
LQALDGVLILENVIWFAGHMTLLVKMLLLARNTGRCN